MFGLGIFVSLLWVLLGALGCAFWDAAVPNIHVYWDYLFVFLGPIVFVLGIWELLVKVRQCDT